MTPVPEPAAPDLQTPAAASDLIAPNVSAAEVERFSALAAEWWNPAGKFKPLHALNKLRLSYVREVLVRHFKRDDTAAQPFSGLSLLDIGCGGGLICEPLARLGGTVTGIDPSRPSIAAATDHALQSTLPITYRVATVESAAANEERYDVVLALEVVEHVPDVEAFLTKAGALVKPGGLMLVATINRTPQAFLFAIVGAEYVLRWLPRGTHHFDQLVTPDEVLRPLNRAGLQALELQGASFNPLFQRWELSRNLNVNYMVLAARPEQDTA